MKTLKAIIQKNSYNKLVFDKIDEFFRDSLFNYLMAVINQKEVFNSTSEVIAALASGKIYYFNGQFYSITGRFSNSISDQLERWGGKYSLRERSFILPTSKLPLNVIQMIATQNIKDEEKLKTISDYLDGLEENVDYLTDQLDFGGEVTEILEDLDGQYRESIKGINIITPELTPYQKQEIKEKYTENMKLYISGWLKKDIIKLRQGVQDFVMTGYRADRVKRYILENYASSAKKTEFLARQETSLMISKFRQTRYMEAGLTKYRWATILDGREREEHKHLNGTIQLWSNPPISDLLTGRRCHPGEDFGCRCRAVPIIDD